MGRERGFGAAVVERSHVVARYDRAGAKGYRTDLDGALTFTFAPGVALLPPGRVAAVESAVLGTMGRLGIPGLSAAVVLNRRARAEHQRTLGRSGSRLFLVAARLLGTIAFLLAVTAALALVVFAVLVLVFE